VKDLPSIRAEQAFDGLHLLALSSFAIAQPLFDLLGRTPAFFAVRGSTSSEIVVFAVGVVLIPPAAALAVEVIVLAALGRTAQKAVHQLFVGCLAALLALQLLRRADVGTAAVVIGLTVALGLVAALAYARYAYVRSVLTAASAAAALFLGLFLLNSPVRKLVLPSDAGAQSASSLSTKAPVVFVIFDEFSELSLMRGDGRIDEGRFPHFAALARTSTWFRNDATVAGYTEKAVPAILTGTLPREDALPVFQDHPHNLFALFGGSHRLEAHEPVTRLCPTDLCPERSDAQISPGLRSLVSDVSVVYSHLIVPKAFENHLPSVSRTWGDFRAEAHADAAERKISVDEARESFRSFVRSIRSDPAPALYFIHVTLPHIPWNYLPSGKRDLAPGYIPGLNEDSTWGPDVWLVRQQQLHYLLQVGYVDRVLGQLLARLRRTGLFDRAAIVVTADHGVSFHPGNHRRLTHEHLEDILFPPLFIKAPGQRSGRILDEPIESIDILPTLADVLGVKLAWRTDGRSALRGPYRRQVSFEGRRYAVAPLLAKKSRGLAEQIRVFGTQSWRRAFASGPHPELLARRPSQLEQLASGRLRAEIEDDSLSFSDVDLRARIVPVYVEGRLIGRGARPGLNVAVAVNGRIAAVARTYVYSDATKFAAVVPQDILRAGRNTVAAYLVVGNGSRSALQLLGRTGAAPTYSLVQTPTGEILRSANGRTLRIVPGAVTGYLDHARVSENQAQFSGWAADRRRNRIRDRIVVFANGRFVYAVTQPSEGARPDLGAKLEDAGFAFSLPLSRVARNSRNARVRLFAVVGKVASELSYPKNYRWSGS